MRARYAANPEPQLVKNRAWPKANPERMREHRRREVESGWRAELNRAWREKNLERSLENARRYRAANRERLRELGRAQYAADPSKFIEKAARRRALIAGADAERVNLDALWTGACGICGDPLDRDLTHPDPRSKSIDHIVPLSRGGTHVAANLQWAHLFCNVAKGARLLN